ncbi:prepilin peptidase [Streptomyces sp. NPDC127106]|uniref:prepilin peptidase n=1 Tax=Streptomyces sp. NPDC127106 TaxID=3345360 RepID=UPI00363504E7
MAVVVIILAAGYGVAAGLLLPRAAYRLSVEPDAPWRGHCPQGHPLHGWCGPARCPDTPDPDTPDPDTPDPGAPGPDSGSGTPGPGARGISGHRYGVRSGRVAALTGVVCAALACAAGPRPEVAVFAGLAPVLVLLALVDLAVHRLPDVLTLPLAAAAAAALGAAALVPGAAGSWRLALLGGAALGAAYLLLFLINPAGMGFGDVKLAIALGVALGWYGWGVWLFGAFLGFLYGALYGLGLVLRSPNGRKQSFPFGPFMAAGALTGLLLGGFGA